METINGIFSEAFWYIAPILASITVAITGTINNLFKIPNGVWRQIVAWIVGACLSIGAYFLNFIEMGDPQWLGVVALSIVVGLSSNGIYDIPTIKAWVNSWFNKKLKE